MVNQNSIGTLDVRTFNELERYRAERLTVMQFPLANRFYQECGYSVSCGRQEIVVCLRAIKEDHSPIVAVARFLPHVEGYFVLRNLCVELHQRRKGLARYLLERALKALGDEALCYCYAFEHLREFYQSVGFVVRSPTQVPAHIAQNYHSYCHKHRGLLLMSSDARLNSHSLAPLIYND